MAKVISRIFRRLNDSVSVLLHGSASTREYHTLKTALDTLSKQHQELLVRLSVMEERQKTRHSDSPATPLSVVEGVRRLLKYRNTDRKAAAESLTKLLLKFDDTRETGRLCTSVLALADPYNREYARAWECLSLCSEESRMRDCPVEFVTAGVVVDLETTRTLTRAWLGKDPSLSFTPSSSELLEIAGIWLAAGDSTLASIALKEAQRISMQFPDPRVDAEVQWLSPWIRTRPNPEYDLITTNGRIAFGVLDYKQPEYRHTTKNLGDYIQTAASLSHLLRFRQMMISCPREPELEMTLRAMADRVPDEMRRDAKLHEIDFYRVDRDASSFNYLPSPIWTLVFGWFMLPQYYFKYDFPLHKNIRPIFISFHIAKERMLTKAALEYLEHYSPIGCRDWNTVALLSKHGIPAFFSGCITSTLNILLGRRSSDSAMEAKLPTLYVDTPGPSGSPHLTHVKDTVRDSSLSANLEDSLRQCEEYSSDYSEIVTSRLHCYLPARALGLKTKFVATDPADPRFAGLIGIPDKEFVEMGRRIEGQLEPVLSAILSGVAEAEVYGLWRELCSDDVADATRYLIELTNRLDS